MSWMDSVREHPTFGLSRVPADTYVCKYRTGSNAGRIAANKSLYLADLSSMGDPWESGRFGLNPVDWGSAHPDFGKIKVEVQRASASQRGATRIISLTRDRPSGEPTSAEYAWTRGYARPRMWESYSENHRGICLVLRLSKLIASFETLTFGPGVSRFFGHVEYATDLSKHFGNLAFDVSGLNLVDVDDAVAKWMFESKSALFLTKNRDWAAEDEFRLVVLRAHTTDPRLVPVGSAAEGLVVGERAAAADFGAAARLASALGIKFSIGQLHWANGIPELSPCVWTSSNELRGMSIAELEGAPVSGTLSM